MVDFGNLGNLGGLVKGLTNLMPQDDPAVQAFAAQSDVADLRKQEMEAFAEIGRAAVAERGPGAFGELGERLRLVQSNLAAAQGKLDAATAQAEAAEQQAKKAEAARTCPSCGHMNSDDTKFCQECGSRLAPAAPLICLSCGVELAPGTRFCGACGARLEG